MNMRTGMRQGKATQRALLPMRLAPQSGSLLSLGASEGWASPPASTPFLPSMYSSHTALLMSSPTLTSALGPLTHHCHKGEGASEDAGEGSSADHGLLR